MPVPGVSDSYGERSLVHFEDSDVLEFVAFFFPNVDLASRKLIDHLIAAKERHRIAGSEIENGAAQFLLGGRRGLHVEPEADRRAQERDHGQRDANARNADPV
jgi:hypothetical protein